MVIGIVLEGVTAITDKSNDPLDRGRAANSQYRIPLRCTKIIIFAYH